MSVPKLEGLYATGRHPFSEDMPLVELRYLGFTGMPGGGTVGDLFVVESLVYSLFVVVVVDSLKTTIKGVDPLQFTSEYTKYIL